MITTEEQQKKIQKYNADRKKVLEFKKLLAEKGGVTGMLMHLFEEVQQLKAKKTPKKPKSAKKPEKKPEKTPESQKSQNNDK